jgi:hypothetical protein
MKHALKILSFASLATILFLMSACSGVPASSTGGGGTTGPFTISVTVTGLTGSGLVLTNNGTDALAIATSGTTAFKTAIALNGAYSVVVQTQPTVPQQTCTVANGTGTATANVTVTVTCATGVNTIGVQVITLLGKGLVLQNNGGDNLTVNAPGTYTFATPVALGNAYNVTVLTQPTSPSQVCTVTNPSGTVAGNVGNITVTCSTGTLSIGGSVSGFAGGTGLVLQDNLGDNLAISANGNFTFAMLLPNNTPYSVSILTQPTGPAQQCTVANASGTTTNVNIVSVQVVCPALFHSIGGQVVGLYVPAGQTSQMVLQDNGGDNLPIAGNQPFTFVSPIANGSSYDVTVFVNSGTQPQGCIVWGYQGTANTDVTDVTVDCGHDDWTWMAGTNTSNQFGKTSTTPPTPPTVDTDTPGGTKYPATWTDLNGNLWQFSGYGYSSDSTIPNQPGFFQEMWKYTGTQFYFAGYGVQWALTPPAMASQVPLPRWGALTWTDPTTGHLWLFGGQDATNEFLNDLWDYNIATSTWTKHAGGFNEPGVYGVQGTPAAANLPGGRWGSTGRLDASGNFWLFGGFGCDSTGTTCSNGLLNDLWKYSGGQWTWVSGSNTQNQNGSYGVQGTPDPANVPGARQAPVSWIDNTGNFWLFGGYNLSQTGQPNAFNDLWEFDSTAGIWTWMSGADVVNQTAIYGIQGAPAISNVPGARWSPAAWNDVDVLGNNRFWIFGGQGFDATGNGSLGDLWVFKSGQWTWVKGPNSVSQIGVYGIQANPVVWPHVVDGPGSRWGAGYWTDPHGQFWMSGGEGFDSVGTNGAGLLSDLWRYLPYPD